MLKIIANTLKYKDIFSVLAIYNLCKMLVTYFHF